MTVVFPRVLQRLCCTLLLIVSVSNASFNLYHTHEQVGCLHYNVTYQTIPEEFRPTNPGHQIIEYCLTGNKEDDEEFETSDDSWTFSQLKAAAVNSEELLRWSAPIDLAEQYEIFLQDSDAWHQFSSNEFYNCTEGWFGSHCEYTFDATGYAFDHIVTETFGLKKRKWTGETKSSGSCYIHLLCDRGASTLSCLDWREICDRKKDCLNGDVDEQEYCIQLEASECDQGEYRCRNGQCIPHAFFGDGDFDCADASDEVIDFIDLFCPLDPSFLCEERICDREKKFACGDGQCQEILTIIRPFNQNCANGRYQGMTEALYTWKYNQHLKRDCSFGLFLLTGVARMLSNAAIPSLCTDTSDCTRFLQRIQCPSTYFFFPRYPIFDGHVHLVFHTNRTDLANGTLLTPHLVCFQGNLCEPVVNRTVFYEGLTCYYYTDLNPNEDSFEEWIDLIKALRKFFTTCSPTTANRDCTNLFQCPQSKRCISKHRFLDGEYDCSDQSDEQATGVCAFNHSNRFQCSSDRNRCISPVLVNDGLPNCPSGEDEQKPQTLPLFSMICDWYPDFSPISFNGRNQTDETDCEPSFPCHNQYTECDGVWNCPNGIEEANCQPSMCPPFHHPCVSLENNSIICLPLNLTNDGIIHCRGGSDERHYCRNLFPEEHTRRYQCLNRTRGCILLEALCIKETSFSSLDRYVWCSEEDSICPSSYFGNNVSFYGLCSLAWKGERSEAMAQLCSLVDEVDQVGVTIRAKRYLTVHHAGYFPSSTRQQTPASSNETTSENITAPGYPNANILERLSACARGILVFKGWEKEKQCFCPPAYYGDRCQYQNQRISVILQFIQRTLLDRHLILHLVIMLINDDQTVQSYDSITYTSAYDCNAKFFFNLLYASRPKDPTKNYTVRIDAFNKKNLNYHSSWYLHIRFPDLPVYHLVARLIIADQQSAANPNHCPIECGDHGQCIKYENVARGFCRCLPGWFGDSCDRSYQCQCSPDSMCIGVKNNQSICVCPLQKFGRLCYLTEPLCQIYSCHSRGICVPNDQRVSPKSFTCLCYEGYAGSRCQFIETKTIVSFADVSIPTSIYAHFIAVIDNAPHVRTSVSKKIALDQNSVTLYRAEPFHILFLEFLDNYYLIVVQEKHTRGVAIFTSVFSSHRCLPISSLFNQTILNYDVLHRMKLYYRACEQHVDLVCFYDERSMCLCNLDRFSNCFEFDHQMIYDCQGINHCQNGGQCFQDNPTCPMTYICVCPQCYFGSQCQLTTKTFDLSLDMILGYQIYPHVSFSNQPTSLKICLALTIIILIIGCVSGVFTLLTFKSKTLREAGCGNYLLALSIVCPLHLIMFALKFLFLVLTQMAIITDRSFLLGSCKSMAFILKVMANIRDWLQVCVSLDRMAVVSRGVRFDKTLSLRMSKLMIVLVQIFVISTAIHDPISSRLIDDVEEQRTWCVANYHSSLQIYNSLMDVVHFGVPFCINILSAAGVILIAARSRSTARKDQTYKEHLWKQFQQHKHLLISPFILTLLALPRLIISFLSGCMVSARNPWIFVISYFTSLLSSAAIFGVFVIPSEVYKEIFLQSIRFRSITHR